jgi:hypothetical protein
LSNFWQAARLLKQKGKGHRDATLSLDVHHILDMLDCVVNSSVLNYLLLGSLLVLVTMWRTGVSPQHVPSR